VVAVHADCVEVVDGYARADELIAHLLWFDSESVLGNTEGWRNVDEVGQKGEYPGKKVVVSVIK
jgi:hypothetical protein